jgi:hypothetical protein
MKNQRTAAFLFLTAAIACLAAGPVFAQLEGDHEAAGAPFDNNGSNPQNPDAAVTPAGSQGQRGGAPLTAKSKAAHHLNVPVPQFAQETVKTVKGDLKSNWKTLLKGASVGALLGVGIGSAIPGAGSVAGGFIGATLGAGVALLMNGEKGSGGMGKTLTGAGAGAILGAAYGSAFPVIGTLIGGIAGAIIGGAMTHHWA